MAKFSEDSKKLILEVNEDMAKSKMIIFSLKKLKNFPSFRRYVEIFNAKKIFGSYLCIKKIQKTG